MPQENVETLRRAYAAFQREGVEGIMPFLDEEIEWRNPEDSPIAGIWRGHDGVRDWFAQASEAFGEMSFSPDEFREVSEHRVLVLLRFGLTGTASALRMEVPFAHVVDLRQGRATSLKMYSHQEDALEAVGLAE
jgi:ketosteroid isomerase-like protein